MTKIAVGFIAVSWGHADEVTHLLVEGQMQRHDVDCREERWLIVDLLGAALVALRS